MGQVSSPVERNQRVTIERLRTHPRNYRKHPATQIEKLKESLKRYGQVRSIVVQEQHRGGFYTIVAGHGLVMAATELVEDDREHYVQFSTLRADIIPADWSEEQVQGYLIADNMLATDAEDDQVVLLQLLQEQVDAGYTLASLGMDDDAIEHMMTMLGENGAGEFTEPEKGKRPNPRLLPLDMIYTLQMADCTCCLAVQAGLKYGIQSAHYALCPYTDLLSGRHKVTFIDNDYFHYDHATHLDAVRSLRPKYATVKDIMTRAQCDTDHIAWTPFEQIMEWAEELQEYAENVIVIPKYDCLDTIPDRFVLGFSIPTSHGRTPVPVERFRGRRVHLLGGSWERQLAYMAELGDDVVSADNNQILLIASQFGEFVHSDGATQSVADAGFGILNNPRYVALALSFGAIGAKIRELYTGSDDDGEDRIRNDATG